MATVQHLYLHFPFCAKVCPYCAFAVEKIGAMHQQKALLTALKKEITQARQYHTLDLKTIYFGGGTPSLIPADLFLEIIACLPPFQGQEFTLEVNPATVTEKKIAAWKKAGVNRISLGAQSFDLHYLKLLGRQHSPEQIGQTMHQLRTAGFTNINIDLMFALPHQPESLWRDTLQAALALQPDHLSAYALTYEEDTPFFAKLQQGHFHLDETREIAMFNETVSFLTAAGLPPYEISNFARLGYESHHNRAYWQGADYLGLGPSAWSTIGLHRYQNTPHLTDYLERTSRGVSPIAEEERLAETTRLKEKIMFGLRTREGVPLTWLKDFSTIVDDLLTQQHATLKNDYLHLTPTGRLVADSIGALFA